jgi:3-deoxy-manno-octulosonate cytidylyltransferase (CMP-KDO synthetase)
MMNSIVLIPARLASTRLPGKPLADICGEPMIVHVWRRASEAAIGPVVVATDAREVAAAVTAAGGRAVLTSSHHRSGSDRIWEALETIDPGNEFDIIVNVQGDLPTIEAEVVRAVLVPFADAAVDIATLAAVIAGEAEGRDPNIVKMVGTPLGPRHYRALYFTRATAPFGPGPLFHHIGLYGFRRAALRRFVSLPLSTLEQRERLEQLRALEAGMRIDVIEVDTVPVGVDNQHELERARVMLKGLTTFPRLQPEGFFGGRKSPPRSQLSGERMSFRDAHRRRVSVHTIDRGILVGVGARGRRGT